VAKIVTSLDEEQLKSALDHMEEERNAIVFLHKADLQKYVKIVEEMEYDILQKKDLFPRTVFNMCGILVVWKYKYGSEYKRFSDVDDGMALTTVSVNVSKKRRRRIS